MENLALEHKPRNKGGRPPMYNSAEELQIEIDNYFNFGVNVKPIVVGPPNFKRIEHIRIPTICGLVLYLGFCNRASFYDMEKLPEFTHTIKTARSRIEQEYEELLASGLGAGAIFALKNIGKWTDEVVHSGDGMKHVVNIVKYERTATTNSGGNGHTSEGIPTNGIRLRDFTKSGEVQTNMLASPSKKDDPGDQQTGNGSM